jgi:hypothetical protein
MVPREEELMLRRVNLAFEVVETNDDPEKYAPPRMIFEGTLSLDADVAWGSIVDHWCGLIELASGRSLPEAPPERLAGQ